MTLSDAARELELYADNTEMWIKPVLQNLSKHHKRGNFSLDLAIHSIERYCLTPAAKQYNLEHGSMTTPWYDIFPKSVRLEAAEVMARRYSDSCKLGNYSGTAPTTQHTPSRGLFFCLAKYGMIA